MNKIKNKTIMVDIDGTLVDFVTMFFNKINDYFNIQINPKDCINYNFDTSFLQMGISETLYKQFYNIWDNDNDFYKLPIYTNDFSNIISFIKEQRKLGYKIILNSKCPTNLMLESKKKFIKKENLYKLFDEIIYDSNVHNPKPYTYDIIIEDNPLYIEKYIKNNSDGKVWIVEQPYNQYLLTQYSTKFIKE